MDEEQLKIAQLDNPELKFTDFLGSGASSFVWRALDKKTGAAYVVKQSTVGIDEALILEKLKKQCHKYYVCIVNYKYTPDYVYIIMEDLPDYITFKTWLIEQWDHLNDLLKNFQFADFKLESRKFEIIFKNLLEAIEHLNQDDKIIHGDIFSHNILINPSTYDIRLIDFGFSSELNETNKYDDIKQLKNLMREILFDTVYFPDEINQTTLDNKTDLLIILYKEEIPETLMFIS